MQKRILSMILSLSIVASLFAGLTFSASAESLAYTLYKTASNETQKKLEEQGIYAEKSLIRDGGAKQTNVYYYVSDTTSPENAAFADVSGLVTGTPKEIGKAANIDSVTDSSYPETDVSYTNIADINKRLFVTYPEGYTTSSVPTALVDNEGKQYLQINYELPAEADISALAVAATNQYNFKFSLKHYKWIFADTEEGLWNSDKYVEVNIDENSNMSISAAKLTNTVRAKWVALRIICGYTTKPTTTYNATYLRSRHVSIQGAYANAASIDGVSAVGYNDNGESEASAVATLAGNTDKNGASPYATVALTAKDKYTGTNGKIYTFDGWYLGEDKIADTATANYTLTGAETTKEFTAKYTEKEYEEYPSSKYNLTATHYAGQLTNNPIADSLIVGKTPVSAHIFNTIEGDYTVSNEPQDYTNNLSSSMSNVTSATVSNSDARFFGNAGLYKKMFIETTTNEGAFVSMTATDDESKQWIQFNYELDGVADIDNILFGRYAAGSKWDVGHFKLILSDTEEGLYTLSSAKAVIEVNSGTNQYKANWNFQFKEDITAKYVGVRVISMYNNNYGTWTETNLGQAYPRFTHLGVHGTYVEPVKEVGTVTATTEDEALKGLVSASDVVYGNPDKNDAYASAEVTVKAEATYSDDAYDYTFAGWFVGEDKYTDAAEFVYDATKGDAAFVAKYDKVVKIIYHTVTVNYFGNFIAEYKVAHGEAFDIEIAREAVMNSKYGKTDGTVRYDFTNTDKCASVTEDVTLGGFPKYRIRFFDKDQNIIGEPTYIGNNATPVAPEAPAVDGYTFTGWDKEVAAISGATDYYAQYAPNKYTVTFMADDKLVEAVEVEYGKAATAPAAPAKEGYTFTGWDVAFDNVTSDLTVTAQYKINEYTVTYEFEGEVVGTETVEHGKTANVPAVDGKEGYNVVWEYNNEAIAGNTTIEGCYVIKTFTVNFYVEGKLVDTQYVDWNTAAKAPEVDAKYGYSFAWDVDFANVTTDLEVNGAYTLTGYVVTFESAAGVVLGTVVVEDGQIPDINEVKAINAKVANIYGYEIAVNEAGDVIWDDDVYGKAIVANMTVRPFYEAKDISTAITLYNLDSKTEYYDHHTQQYDTAITLSCEGAKSWVDENGNVLLDTAEGVLYACGSRMKLYPVSEQKTAPVVAIVGKINDGNYSVFAHVNVENATEYGVVFASKTAYANGDNADFNLDDVAADAEAKAGTDKKPSYTVVKIDATKVGQVDFMATLNNTGDKTRYARAYVKVGEDYIYTSATCNK